MLASVLRRRSTVKTCDAVIKETEYKAQFLVDGLL